MNWRLWHRIVLAGTALPGRPRSAPNPSVQNSHKLFCGLEEDVREGDRIVVTLRTEKTVELTLGECHPYTYQWQCEVKRDDNA